MKTDFKYRKSGEISIKYAAIIAGIGLLLMAILAPVANFAILQKLIVSDDAVKTFSNIVADEGLFRIGICLFLIVALLDVIVAWALYIYLKPVNSGLSLLAAWIRIVYATMLALVLIYLLNVLPLLHATDQYLTSFNTNQLQTMLMLSLNSFNTGWGFALIIFGFHLLLLGYLVFKAGYMRKILGVLLLIAALGYLIDGFGNLLSADYFLNISMITFFGELVLIFWLLIKGWKINDDSTK